MTENIIGANLPRGLVIHCFHFMIMPATQRKISSFFTKTATTLSEIQHCNGEMKRVASSKSPCKVIKCPRLRSSSQSLSYQWQYNTMSCQLSMSCQVMSIINDQSINSMYYYHLFNLMTISFITFDMT